MGIFPEVAFDFNNSISEKNNPKEEDIIREYAWDFENNDFLLRDGKFVVVEGKEALKIWIWKALHTAKDRYDIYSSEYGNRLENLIGKGYSKGLVESKAKRFVWECLQVNKHIKSIENFSVDFVKDRLKLTFDVNTDVGLITMNNVPV